MTGGAPISRLVLSPFPLAVAERESAAAAARGGVRFEDLASLRRGGLRGTWSRLRSLRADEVLVAGGSADLVVFRDLLLLMAAAVPCRRRLCGTPGAGGEPISAARYLLSACRILSGTLAGLTAMAEVWVRALRLARAAPDACPRGRVGRRCLYLRPALNLGAAVGGAVGHVAGVANALARRGFSLRLLATARQPLVSPEIEQAAVPPVSPPSYPHELNLFRYQRRFLREARRQLSGFRPDWIYQRYSVNDLTGVRLRRKTRLPLLLEFNGSEIWTQKHWGQPLRFEALSETIERANLRHADLVVVVSREIENQVRHAGVPAHKILFIPNGVDPAVFDPDRFGAAERRAVREALGVPLEADLFTFVGTFGRWHGTVTLAQAILRLAAEHACLLRERRAHFLFVGDGAHAAEVRSMLSAPAAAHLVTFAGYRPQEEAPAILGASDIFLSPHIPNRDGSPFFGSPTKIFEYMAMARPIVASDLDQIGWVLRGWRPGTEPPGCGGRSAAAAILLEPGSIDELVAGILRAIAMPAEERAAMGGRARAFAASLYTWTANVDAAVARLNEMMGEST